MLWERDWLHASPSGCGWTAPARWKEPDGSHGNNGGLSCGQCQPGLHGTPGKTRIVIIIKSNNNTESDINSKDNGECLSVPFLRMSHERHWAEMWEACFQWTLVHAEKEQAYWLPFKGCLPKDQIFFLYEKGDRVFRQAPLTLQECYLWEFQTFILIMTI